MSDLEKLAERCEQASGPDRELDVAIGLMGKFYVAEPRYAGAKPMIGYVDDDGSRVEPGNGSQDRLVPEYTASLDAAMTLVPEGRDKVPMSVRIHRFFVDDLRGTMGRASLFAPYSGEKADGRGATPALALCAAALRARSNTGEGPANV